MNTLSPENLDTLFEEKLDIAKTLGGATQWYGLRMRPYSIGAQPKDVSCFVDDELAGHVFSKVSDVNNIRHGAVAYPYALDKEDVTRFELVPLDVEGKGESFIGGFSGELNTESLSLDMINIMFKEDHAGKKLTFDLFDEWTDFMLENGIEVLKKYVRYHPVFINRQNDKEKYTHFLEVFKTISIDSLTDAIVDNYLS
jgi:hypothetical protein